FSLPLNLDSGPGLGAVGVTWPPRSCVTWAVNRATWDVKSFTAFSRRRTNSSIAIGSLVVVRFARRTKAPSRNGTRGKHLICAEWRRQIFKFGPPENRAI